MECLSLFIYSLFIYLITIYLFSFDWLTPLSDIISLCGRKETLSHSHSFTPATNKPYFVVLLKEV